MKNSTPLHYASQNGHLNIVQYLISQGANIESKDKQNRSSLHIASQGININLRTNQFETPIYLSNFKKKDKCTKYQSDLSKSSNYLSSLKEIT